MTRKPRSYTLTDKARVALGLPRRPVLVRLRDYPWRPDSRDRKD